MKLLRSAFSSFMFFYCLLFVMTPGIRIASAQSITFSPAEKPVPLPAGVGPYSAIAADGGGDLFFPLAIAGSFSTSAVKVSPSGVVTTIVSGLLGVTDLKLDPAGNVYVADFSNNDLVKITPSGTQTVVSSGLNIGRPNNSFLSDFAVDGAGNIYISDNPNNQVLKVTPKGSKSTVVASGFAPAGIAVDGNGNIYVSDDTNGRVVKIAATGAVTVLASGLNTPTALTLDSALNVYVVTLGTPEVLKIAPSGVQTNLYDGSSDAGGGVGSVAVDGSGNIYVAQAIGEIGGNIVELQNTTIAAGDVNFGVVWTAFDAQLNGLQPNPPIQPVTFSFHATTNVASVQVLTNGASNLDFQSASGGTCQPQTYTSGQTCTVNVQFLPTHAGLRDGAVLLNDSAGNALSMVNLRGFGAELTFALDPGVPNAIGISGLKDPSAVAVDGVGNVFIADKGNDRVLKLATNGALATIGSGLISPTGLAVDGAGDVYISDTGNDRVVKVSPSGQQTTVLTGLSIPDGVAVDGLGNLYVADSGNNRVVKLSVDGVTQSTIGTGYSRPTGVALDRLGDVFVADFGNNQIVQVAPGGAQTTVAGNLAGPTGVAVDAGEDLYIAEVSSNDVIMISPILGQRITVLGTGLNFPFDAVLVAVNTGGDVFVADTLNNRVLKVDRSNANLNFGTVAVGQSSPSQTVVFSNIGPGSTNGSRSPAPRFTDTTDFTQSMAVDSDCGREFVNKQCSVVVTFTPKTAGNLSGTATINMTVMQVPAVIHLNGTGQ